MSGTIGRTDYTISASSGALDSGHQISGPGCQPWLACEDVEISGDAVTYETITLLGTVPTAGDRITLVIDHHCMANPSDCL